MIRYADAVRQHAILRDCDKQDCEAARELFLATMGDGDPMPDSFAEAISDLAPAEYDKILARGGTANVYALSCFWPMRNGATLLGSGQKAEGSSVHGPLRSGNDKFSHGAFAWRETARHGWEKFKERAEEVGMLVGGLGCDDEAAWETTEKTSPVRDRFDEVKTIAKLAGRVYRMLKGAQAERVAAMPEEVYDVELGNTLSRLLPSELAHLGQPTEVLLLDRIASGRCLQYRVRGTDVVGRGPLCICLDESASMRWQRRNWSKAVALAMARVAWEDKRHVSILHFGTSVIVRELKPGDTDALIDMLFHFLDAAGTRIALALENAAHQIEVLRRRGDQGADIVLISDGEDHHHDAQGRALDAIRKLSARLWTVAIECNLQPDNPLRARAAQYAHIDAHDLATGDVGSLKGAVV